MLARRCGCWRWGFAFQGDEGRCAKCGLIALAVVPSASTRKLVDAMLRAAMNPAGPHRAKDENDHDPRRWTGGEPSGGRGTLASVTSKESPA